MSRQKSKTLRSGPPLKLSECQRQILEAASGRPDGLVVIEKGSEFRFRSPLNALIRRGLLQPIKAPNGAPAWRVTVKRKATETSIPRAAVKTMGVESPPDTRLDKTKADAPVEVSTAGACEGLDQGEDEAADYDVAGDSKPASPTHAGGSKEASRTPATGSKRALIIEMLRHANGAALAELATATGWLPHTTRAALTGLRHAGFVLEKSKGEDGKTLYRIVADGTTASQLGGGGSDARAA